MMAKYSTESHMSSELEISARLAEAASDQSTAGHILKLQDVFQQKGPNGTHTCLVFEPMGGTVASMSIYLPPYYGVRPKRGVQVRYPKSMAKRILRHTLLGLSFLHHCGLVHGDIQHGNLLFTISGLDAVDERQLTQDEAYLGKPLERLDGKADRWAPRRLALAQPLWKFANVGPTAYLKISDFGAGESTG